MVVGKTTLSQTLARHYCTAWVAEYGREYTEWKMSRNDVAARTKDFVSVEWNSEDFRTIAAEQNRNELAAARRADRILICDTDSFATYIWHEHYMGNVCIWFYECVLIVFVD